MGDGIPSFFSLNVSLGPREREIINNFCQEKEEAARVVLRIKIDDALRETSKQLDDWVNAR
jgi:hypothetical protein